MTNILRITTLLATILVASSPAFAQDYGNCASAIAIDAPILIAPVVPIKSITAVTPEILAAVVAQPDDMQTGDSIVPVSSQYSDPLHRALTNYFDVNGAWIGVVESKDGNEDPALWMTVYANTDRECVVGEVDNRVYNQRSNAPTVFWKEILAWEAEHPKSVLFTWYEVVHLIESVTGMKAQ